MNDDKLRRRLKNAQQTADGSAPPFADVWARAEARRGRWRIGAGVAAAVVTGVVALLIATPETADPVYIDLDELQASTMWVAPSDALLPARRFDIFHELPVMFESTGGEEGALL